MMEKRFDEILDEADPARQVALARRLRSELRKALSPDDIDQLRNGGVDVGALPRVRVAD